MKRDVYLQNGTRYHFPLFNKGIIKITRLVLKNQLFLIL